MTNSHIEANLVHRYKCGNCHTIISESIILKAPNPFDENDEIWGCPQCKNVEDFYHVCDAVGCDNTNVSGIPVGDTYMFLCYAHARKMTKQNE